MIIEEIVKRKNSAQKYVHDNLDRKEIIMQLAEEASELSQACLKYIRALDGKNPCAEQDPMAYMANIIEEFADVSNAAETARIYIDYEIVVNKAERWADRLKAVKESEGINHE